MITELGNIFEAKQQQQLKQQAKQQRRIDFFKRMGYKYSQEVKAEYINDFDNTGYIA